jgi:AcrR family transcriptional regulator
MVKTRPSQPRPDTRDAVMRATAALLAEVGVSATTAEAIAARAKVSKATLYRWWPNKTAVAIEAFAAHMAEEVQIPDTGSGRDDLVAQLGDVVMFFSGANGRILTDLIADAQNTPETTRELYDRFFIPRRQAVRELWSRGVCSGAFGPAVEPELAIDLIYGPVIYRLLTGTRTLTEAELPAYVDTLLTGLAAAQPTTKGGK